MRYNSCLGNIDIKLCVCSRPSVLRRSIKIGLSLVFFYLAERGQQRNINCMVHRTDCTLWESVGCDVRGMRQWVWQIVMYEEKREGK